MLGRLENEIKVENKIKDLLKDKPEVIKSYAGNFIDKSYNTKLVYINKVLNFINFLSVAYDMDVYDDDSYREIKLDHINYYMETLLYRYDKEGNKIKNTNSYISNVLAAIKDFFSFLVKSEIIEYNPCEKMMPPKDKREHEVVSLAENEINTLINNIKTGVGSKRAMSYQKKWENRDLAIVVLGITTGLRVSAICNINLEDINFKESYIKVIEKGEVGKRVIVPQKALDILQLWKKDRKNILKSDKVEALFISSQKKRVSTMAVRNIVKKYSYNINKHITPHKLRSTCATSLYDKTGDIYLVAEVLGHKNIQNTMRYTKVSTEKRKNAANMLGNMIN